MPTDHPSRREFLVTATAASAMAVAPCCTQEPSPLPAGARHVVLLGDSILDNGVYVPGRPSVSEQLAAALGRDERSTLLATDGDMVADVTDQLARLPTDATHLVISVGGNDALQHSNLLEMRIQHAAELLAAMSSARSGFRAAYATMLDKVLERGKPTAVCTIYDSNFEEPKKALADVALTIFNDAIIRCAGEAGVPVIDLRRIFTARADYANSIEPSEVGGEKLVAAILRVTAEHDFTVPRATFWA